MKVMLISPLPPPSGGMATWTVLFRDYCNSNGIVLEIVNAAISAKRANDKARRMSICDEIVRNIRIIKEFWYKKHHSPDIIHICSPCTKFGLIRDFICTKMVGSIPFVFHCHCNIEDQATTAISRWFFSQIAKKAAIVIVLNSRSAQYVENNTERTPTIIPNCIVGDTIAEDRVIKEKIECVSFVGHVTIEKGIKEIVDVAKEFHDILFRIIGPVQELPEGTIPGNMEFLGEVEHSEVNKLLNESDVFFFPSHTEGFSNVMLEAMAAGLPIIATDVGANLDIVENKGGIIVPVCDTDAMRQAFIDIEEKRVRQTMSDWNIKKVKSSYLVEPVMNTIVRRYEQYI